MLTFDVALHVGTLFALLAYFRKDVAQLIRAFFASLTTRIRTPQQRLAWLIIVAAVPAAVFGFLFDSFFESIRSPVVVIAARAVFGVLFLVVERWKRDWDRTMVSMSWRTALGIGFAQVLALVPGVSRSGVTIVAGMFAGLKRDEAARFTFLLSIPVVAGAAGKKLFDLHSALPSHEQLKAMLAGIAVATFIGYSVIRYLLRFLANHRLNVFAYYRFTLAAVAAGILLFR
jgi:undecaprenyl-diphosphatase